MQNASFAPVGARMLSNVNLILGVNSKSSPFFRLSEGDGLPDVIEAGQELPELGEGPHQVPDPGAQESVLGDQGQAGGEAAGILEPHFVDGAAGVGIVEEGGLGRLVVLDGHVVLDGQLDGPLVGDGGSPGDALDKGQGPVVAVVGEAQEDFGRRDLGDSVIQHRPDIGEGRHRHGRPGGIAPLI